MTTTARPLAAISPPGGRPGGALGSSTGPDAVPVIALYLVALFAIPSDYIVRPLGAAGTPAQIVALVLLAWWFAGHLTARTLVYPTGPVKWLLLLFVAAMLTSYVAGMSRPISSALEVNSSDRALLSLAAWSGVVLVMADGVGSRRRLETLVRVVAVAVTAIAVLGYLQFFLGIDIGHLVHIPGLAVNGDVSPTFDRSGYRRVSGTTSHPIEFGVVLSATLPLVIHCARFASSPSAARRWWVAVAVVAGALPMSVARSAMLGGAIAVAVLFFSWPGALRRKMLVAGALGGLATYALVPGLLGTIKSLFLNFGSDPSTQGRTADYGPAWDYIRESPVVGRGIGTFIPETYRTLDNQYLGTVIETGLLGLLTLLALLGGTVVVAWRIRRATDDARVRDLALALVAGVLVVAVNAATFDAFGFSMCVGTLFVLVGAVASLWTLQARASDTRSWFRATSRPRHRIPIPSPGVAAGLVVATLALCLTGATLALVRSTPEYRARETLVVVAPQSSDLPAYQRTGNAGLAASVLHDIIDSPPVRADIARRASGSFEIAVGDGSLEHGTDRIALGPTLRIQAAGPTPEVADDTLRAVLAEASARLSALQATVGVVPSEALRTETVNTTPATPVGGRRSRALLGWAVLSALVLSVAWRTYEMHRLRVHARHVARRPERLPVRTPVPD